MKSTTKIIIAFLWCVYAICYNTPVSARSRQTDIKKQPIRIILDTDIGNDVDVRWLWICSINIRTREL